MFDRVEFCMSWLDRFGAEIVVLEEGMVVIGAVGSAELDRDIETWE